MGTQALTSGRRSPPIYSRAEDAVHHPTASLYPSRKAPGANKQRQLLSLVEQRTFEDLLRAMVPSPDRERRPSSSDVWEGDRVKAAVTASSVREARKKSRAAKGAHALSDAESTRLDSMREVMAAFQTDHELLRWAERDVFGGELAPSQACRSPIFPDLVLILFMLLRDTHRSPHAALHVFALAARTPESYVRGCTTKLYNELLRTRWMVGDLESVAAGLEEMRAGGVRVNDTTMLLVEEIGQAVLRDGQRAAALAARSRPQSPPPSLDLTSDVAATPAVEKTVDSTSSSASDDSYRLFSPSQLAAWARSDSILEEIRREQQEQHAAAMEHRHVRYQAESESEIEPARALKDGGGDGSRDRRRDETWDDFPL